MDEQTVLDRSVGGVTLLGLVFSFIGSALSISYLPPMTRKEQAFALVAGLACGSLVPELAILTFEILGWEGVANVARIAVLKNSFAFVFGILGIFIVPGIIVMGQEFKTDPVGTIRWVLGRGQRPTTIGGTK